MAITNEDEVMRVKQRIENFLAKDRQLKAELKENSRNIQIAEEYLAHLLGKQVSEISSVKSITDHLEDLLFANMRPMKAQELWEMIRAIPGLENTALPTITTALIRNSNKGKRFKKVAPNTYELLVKKKEDDM